MSAVPDYHTTADALVDAVIDEVGKDIVLGLPLGLGKANHIANALFERAVADSSITLRIFTALTLEPPAPAAGSAAPREAGRIYRRPCTKRRDDRRPYDARRSSPTERSGWRRSAKQRETRGPPRPPTQRACERP